MKSFFGTPPPAIATNAMQAPTAAVFDHVHVRGSPMPAAAPVTGDSHEKRETG